MTDTSFSPQEFNSHMHHPLQAYEWGVFREKTGVKVVRGKDFQLTIHSIPRTKFTIGYLPKGEAPTKELIEELKAIGKANKCLFIQLEPDVKASPDSHAQMSSLGLRPAGHPLFTKFTFQLNISQPEEELLSSMHSKTRYNIRVAQKHGVTVQEDNSDDAFKTYVHLTNETTNRQGFYAHSDTYHKLQWETLPHTPEPNRLSSHLLTATYQGKILVAWIVFVFQDTLYYPYGASSSEHREAMASTLMMWEAIRFGKKLGLKKFDMWGSLGPDADPKDPWYGFHRFKSGFGPELVEFVGSYDLVINKPLYPGYVAANKLRWLYLRLRK